MADETDKTDAPAEKPAKKPAAKAAPKKPWAVYSGGKTDTVSASKIIYENQKARNSLSVLHLQRALVEQGYTDTLSDKGGYYSAGTQKSLEAFRKDKKIPADADLYAALEVLFDGDPNVSLTR